MDLDKQADKDMMQFEYNNNQYLVPSELKSLVIEMSTEIHSLKNDGHNRNLNPQKCLIQLLLDKHITIDQFTVLYAPFSQENEKHDYIESEDGKRFAL